MALTTTQNNQVTADLNDALAALNAAKTAGNLVSMKSAADRANRDLVLWGAVTQIFYGGYVLPADYCSVPPLAGIPNPGCSSTTPPSSGTTTSPSSGTTTPPSSGTTPPIKPALPKSQNVTSLLGLDGGDYCTFFPEDPFCGGGGWGPGFPFPFPGGGSGPTNITYETIVEGVDEPTVWSDIWGGLGTLWSIVIGAVDAAFVSAIQAIQAALTHIAQALSDAFHALARLGGLILKFLQSVWYKLLRGLAAAVSEIAKRLGDLYEKVLKPALKALAKIRAKLLDIYNRFIRPVILIIQRLRQVLAILKVFHIRWASKLDAVLQDIQTRIIQPYLQVLGYLNQIANWLNLITTAGGLIQRPVWLASFDAYKGSSINLQLNAMNPSAAGSDLDALRSRGTVVSSTQTAQDMQQWLDTGVGPFATVSDSGIAAFSAMANPIATVHLVAPAWRVGQPYTLAAAGQPGQAVEVSYVKDGVPLGRIQQFVLGPDGTFAAQGQVVPAQVGAWVETWYVGDQQVASYSYTVSP